jgi:hypothetical protein
MTLATPLPPPSLSFLYFIFFPTFVIRGGSLFIFVIYFISRRSEHGIDTSTMSDLYLRRLLPSFITETRKSVHRPCFGPIFLTGLVLLIAQITRYLGSTWQRGPVPLGRCMYFMYAVKKSLLG